MKAVHDLEFSSSLETFSPSLSTLTFHRDQVLIMITSRSRIFIKIGKDHGSHTRFIRCKALTRKVQIVLQAEFSTKPPSGKIDKMFRIRG